MGAIRVLDTMTHRHCIRHCINVEDLNCIYQKNRSKDVTDQGFRSLRLDPLKFQFML